MQLIDTHCHLTTFEDVVLRAAFENAKRCHVGAMVSIGAGEGIESAKKAVSLAENQPAVWASVGIHPHDAMLHASLRELESLLAHPKVVAIGETGLDFFRDWAPKDLQEKLFIETLSLAQRFNKPVIIHCREAREEIFQILKKHYQTNLRGVFHCFSETAEFAAQVKEMGFLVSFTGNITFKKAGPLREVVKQIPLTQIMLETDAPYMAPEPFRGSSSEPMHVYQVALKIAEIKGITVEEVAEITTENAKKLFSFGKIPD